MEQMTEYWVGDTPVISNDVEAERAGCRIREINAETDRLIKICEEQIAFYEKRKRELEEEWHRKTELIEGWLRAYFDTVDPTVTPKGTQRKYKLATCTLVERQQNPLWEHDDERLMADFPDFVKVKHSFDWAEFKKHIEYRDDMVITTDTGEYVAGVKVTLREPVFDVEV